MKYRITSIAMMAAVLSLPVSAYAHEPVAPSQQQMSCPMMGSMQKDMGNMMGDMDSMMRMMSDPAMKERMQKMHAHMQAMMQQMEEMQKGMGGMMMQDGSTDNKKANESPAATSPEDHQAHHPESSKE